MYIYVYVFSLLALHSLAIFLKLTHRARLSEGANEHYLHAILLSLQSCHLSVSFLITLHKFNRYYRNAILPNSRISEFEFPLSILNLMS